MDRNGNYGIGNLYYGAEVVTIPIEKTEEFINIIRKFIPELQ